MVILVSFHHLQFHKLVGHVLSKSMPGPFEVLKIEYVQQWAEPSKWIRIVPQVRLKVHHAFDPQIKHELEIVHHVLHRDALPLGREEIPHGCYRNPIGFLESYRILDALFPLLQ